MRIRHFIFVIAFTLLFLGQEECRGQGTFSNKDRDTIIILKNDTYVVDSIIISRVDYYDLLSKVLEQKQEFYDSSLSTLNFWAAVVAVFFGLMTVFLGILAFVGFSRVGDIKNHLEDGLEIKMRKVTTDKYEADIGNLYERMRLLELDRKPDKEETTASHNPFDAAK